MYFGFKDIERDAYGNIENSPIILKTLHGEVLGLIEVSAEPSFKFRLNDVSEVSFEVSASSPLYSEVVGMRVVEIPPFGEFILTKPVERNDGITAVKSCSGYSREYELGWKNIYLESGTYNFWNPHDPENTILYYCMELIPNWKIGSISSSLIGRFRTFDVSEASLYDFMMNTLQKSYNCLFIFDSKEKTVNAVSTDDVIGEMPIFLSFDNLNENVDVTELTDDIVTCLTPYGADPVTTLSVNPLGVNKIYNLDYFIANGDIPSDIAEKWLKWRDTFKLYQPVFGSLSMVYNAKLGDSLIANAKLNDLKKELESIEYNRSAAIEAVTKTENVNDGEHELAEKNLKECNENIKAQKEKIKAQEAVVDEAQAVLKHYKEQKEAIIELCSFSTFFTDEELLILNNYIKEDSLTEDTFVLSEFGNYNAEDTNAVLDGGALVSVSKSQIKEVTFAETFDEVYENIDKLNKPLIDEINKELNENRDYHIYDIKGGRIAIESSKIEAEIVRGTVDYNPETDRIIASLSLAKLKYGEETYTNASLYITGDTASFKVVESDKNGDTMDFSLKETKEGEESNNFMALTHSVSEYQQQIVEQELYDYAADCLNKLAYPSYQFSVDSANIIFARDFEPFKNALALGRKLSLAINDDYIVHPILIGVDLDYGKPDSFSLTFGDKFRLSDSVFSLVDLLSDSITSAAKADFSKFNYASFKNSGASTAVHDYMQSALDVAKNNVMSSAGQAVSWDSSGLHLRKYLEEGGGYEDEEIAFINNSIVFTDNGWNTAKMAIGKFTDANTGESWGVVAPSIVGTLLAGENLIIENRKTNDDGTLGTMQFKVDATGAYLNNATYLIQSDDGGKMLFDPKYGFAGGTGSLYTIDEDGKIIPSFIDTDGKSIKFDTDNMPTNANFYIDVNTGEAYFRGTIYADSGRFNGVVQASDFLNKSGVSMLGEDDKIKSDYLNLRGLNIVDGSGNVNLSIDENGKVEIRNGSISWGSIIDPDNPEQGTLQDYVDTGVGEAKDAASRARSIARQIANGTYSGGTFIDGTSIYSPEIYGNSINVYTDNSNQGNFSYIAKYNGKEYEMFRIDYLDAIQNPYVYLGSPAGAPIQIGNTRAGVKTTIEAKGIWDFGDAEIKGLVARFG